jgi:hypothetical protein
MNSLTRKSARAEALPAGATTLGNAGLQRAEVTLAARRPRLVLENDGGGFGGRPICLQAVDVTGHLGDSISSGPGRAGCGGNGGLNLLRLPSPGEYASADQTDRRTRERQRSQDGLIGLACPAAIHRFT